jgi:prolyl oligopeptidase
MRFGHLVLAFVFVGAAAGGWSALGADKMNHDRTDPYLWLEDIHGAKPMDWVKAQNAKSLAVLKSDPDYQGDYDSLLKVMDATDRIPFGHIDHQYVVNFWQDAEHPKGIWRRTTIADYANVSPNWETLIDLDKLAADEHEDWVWEGGECSPDKMRCLVRLSRGGGDAVVVREFDLGTRSFLKDGFALKEAKSQITYLDDNTVLFGTDFGPGTMTTSGYPNIVKLWKRGQPMAGAKTIYTGQLSDVSSGGVVFDGPSATIALVQRGPNFFTAEYYYVMPDGATMKLPLPLGADLKGASQGNLIFTLRDDWTPPGGTEAIKKGSLVAFPVKPFVMQKMLPVFTVLYTPDARSTVDQVSTGRDAVYASIYNNVIGSVHVFRPGADGKWSDTKLDLPGAGSTSIVSTNDWGPEAYFSFENFTTPTTLYADAGDDKLTAIKLLPARFDAANIETQQFEATSKDGTQVP